MIGIKTIAAVLSIFIGVIGVASLFPYLDVVARMSAIAAFAAALLTVKRGTLLRGPLPAFLSVAAFVLYGLKFSAGNLIDPAVNLLVVLLAVRLASEKNVRHHLQVSALSLFVLAASSLYDLGPMFLLYLVLMLVLIAVSLVILTFCTGDRDLFLTKDQLRRIFSVALLLPAGTAPLLLLFFMVLPRTQYPLWNFLNRNQTPTTGLSEEVRPGSAPSVSAVKTPVFRAAMPEIDRNLLYWRGIVLNSFRDNSWQRDYPPDYGLVGSDALNRVLVTMLAEPRKGKYLVTLDLPVRLDGLARARHHGDLVYSMPNPVERRVRYDVVAAPGAVVTVGKGIDRSFYLRLPEQISPRLRELGALIGSGGDAGEKISRAENYYRTARFRYASTGLPTGEGALDSFLFETRVGHCELFASSLAVLLRLAGVPCRLVGGYYGGSYNALGGYYIVTEDMAHLWVEAFVEGKGWVRLDPSSWAAGFGPAERSDTGVSQRLRLWADTVAYSWNMAVVSYDLESQLRLFNAAGERVLRVDARKTLPRLFIPVAALLAIAAAVAVFRSHRVKSREERVLEQFLAMLREKHGVARQDPSQGLHDLAAQAGSELADRFVELYSGIVYRDRKLSNEDYRRLKRILKRM